MTDWTELPESAALAVADAGFVAVAVFMPLHFRGGALASSGLCQQVRREVSSVLDDRCYLPCEAASRMVRSRL